MTPKKAPNEVLRNILEAKKGIRQAQNNIIAWFWFDVYNYVLAKKIDNDEAEDITIETFTKVLSKLALYNEDFNFKTWIISIAQNTLIDHVRKNPNPNVSLDNDYLNLEIRENNPSPEEKLINKQNNEAVLKNIKKLPEKYQRIIELRYLEDKTYKEMSEILNLPIPNTKVTLFRAKKLLIDHLNNDHNIDH